MKRRAVMLALLLNTHCAFGGDVDIGISTIVPRGGGLATECEVVGVSPAGVLIKDGAKQSMIGLDRIKEIRGDGAEAFAPFAQLAQLIWRARIRLERSDISGAEPLFEANASTFSMMSGPTAAVVHVGLMRCRLERGAFAGALVPWINAVAAGDAVDHAASILRSDRQDALLIDRETGLAPALAPIFIDVASTRALLKSEWPHEIAASAAGDPQRRALELSAWYRAALCFELKERVEIPEASGTADRGVLLVRDMVQSRVGDEAKRASARTSLKMRGQEAQSPWILVWTDVAIGRSLLLEQDEESKLLGIGVLLEVVAAHASVLPELTGIALADAADALRNLGEIEAAAKLRAELVSMIPGHGALDRRETGAALNSVEPPGQGSQR